MPPSNHLLTSITKHFQAWTPCSFLFSPSAGDRTGFGRNHQVAFYYSESPVKRTDNPLGMLKVFDLLSAKKPEEWGGRSGRTPKESPEEAAPTVPLLPGTYSRPSIRDSGRWPQLNELRPWQEHSQYTAQIRREKKTRVKGARGFCPHLLIGVLAHLNWQDLAKKAVQCSLP